MTRGRGRIFIFTANRTHERVSLIRYVLDSNVNMMQSPNRQRRSAMPQLIQPAGDRALAVHDGSGGFSDWCSRAILCKNLSFGLVIRCLKSRLCRSLRSGINCRCPKSRIYRRFTVRVVHQDPAARRLFRN